MCVGGEEVNLHGYTYERQERGVDVCEGGGHGRVGRLRGGDPVNTRWAGGVRPRGSLGEGQQQWEGGEEETLWLFGQQLCLCLLLSVPIPPSPHLPAEPWLARSVTSPTTGAALAAPTLIPNRALSQALEAWRQQQPAAARGEQAVGL